MQPTDNKSIEDIARERGVSEIAIRAWKSINVPHDFLPWEFDNITGECHRGPGYSGFCGTDIRNSWETSFGKRFRNKKKWALGLQRSGRFACTEDIR